MVKPSFYRPRHLLKTKPGLSISIAASDFQKIPHFMPPVCPHVYNQWRTAKECEMEAY
jgi:hypothetical protein